MSDDKLRPIGTGRFEAGDGDAAFIWGGATSKDVGMPAPTFAIPLPEDVQPAMTARELNKVARQLNLLRGDIETLEAKIRSRRSINWQVILVHLIVWSAIVAVTWIIFR